MFFAKGLGGTLTINTSVIFFDIAKKYFRQLHKFAFITGTAEQGDGGGGARVPPPNILKIIEN